VFCFFAASLDFEAIRVSLNFGRFWCIAIGVNLLGCLRDFWN
jgi:hypothetical protein